MNQYMKINEFREYYKSLFLTEGEFYKSSALTDKEIIEIRKYIKALQDKGATSKIIIKHLQHFNPKIKELWKAERVYFTEIKRQDSKEIGEAGEELEIKSYKVVLSPSACATCIKKTGNGSKIFKNSDIQKAGYGHIPPFHPNCYCVLLPKE